MADAPAPCWFVAKDTVAGVSEPDYGPAETECRRCRQPMKIARTFRAYVAGPSVNMNVGWTGHKGPNW